MQTKNLELSLARDLVGRAGGREIYLMLVFTELSAWIKLSTVRMGFRVGFVSEIEISGFITGTFARLDTRVST